MKFNKLVPELYVANLNNSLKFYFMIGFKEEYRRDKFIFLSLQGSQIMLQEADEDNEWATGKLDFPRGRGINLQFEVNDLYDIYLKSVNNKIKIFAEIREAIYKVNNKSIKMKEFLVQDPDGYLLRFSETIK